MALDLGWYPQSLLTAVFHARYIDQRRSTKSISRVQRSDFTRLIVIGPQMAKAEKTSLTEMVRVMMLLTDRLDGLMEQFKGDGSSFYADYHNARKIIDNKGPGAKTPPPTP